MYQKTKNLVLRPPGSLYWNTAGSQAGRQVSLSIFPSVFLPINIFRYDPILGEYYFDRRPTFFADILGLYQVGVPVAIHTNNPSVCDISELFHTIQHIVVLSEALGVGTVPPLEL